ncbi:MAG TPA: CdaR family protein [Gemmatimonadota bacterium]|nr:CdaR family protein [Gemmatimonadota bacterium]
MALAAPIRDFFTRNLGYKAVALVLALLLWYDVTSEETTVIEYPVPLQIAVEGADMIITNQAQLPPEVEVAFSGTGKELLRLDKDDLAVQERVLGGENDSIVVTLDLGDVRKPADLAITPIGITPRQVTVVTDRFMERTVPLATVGTPRPAEGYRIEGVDVTPSTVRVRGVTAEVRPIGSLGLDLSQIGEVEGEFDERMEIAIPESLRTVTVTPDTVRIRGRAVPDTATVSQ